MGLSPGRGYSIKPKYIIQIEDVAKAYRFERGGRGRRASPSLPGDGGVSAELLRTAVAWRGPGASGLQGAVDGSLPGRVRRDGSYLLRARSNIVKPKNALVEAAMEESTAVGGGGLGCSDSTFVELRQP